jgi:hypothetical protein
MINLANSIILALLVFLISFELGEQRNRLCVLEGGIVIDTPLTFNDRCEKP